MAKEKFNVGDTVRLKKQISFGTVHIRANTVGTIRLINSKTFGNDEFHIRFNGTRADLVFKGSKEFVSAPGIEGQVFKS